MAQEFGPQAGPSALGPRGRCARPLLTHGVADSGPPLSASSLSSGRPNRRHDRAICAIFAPRDSLVAFSTSWRTSGPPKLSLSPSLAPMATGAADGYLGRADAGHYDRVERELNSAKASVAHRDFSEAHDGGRGARSRPSRGEELAAALRPESGEKRLGCG